MKLNYATLALIVVGVVLFAAFSSHLPWTAPRVVGIAIAAPSLILLVVARIQLGRAFSVQAKASELITAGLYARIRNPIYFFGAWLFLGLIIWTGRPWLLIALAALISLQIVRSRKEAHVLEEKFGDAYRAYRKKTWF